MMHQLKNTLHFIAQRNNIYVTGTTSQSQLRDLQALLTPVNVGIPLIRLGGNADGGYLLPDDLKGVDYCFSPGVADCVDFELSLVQRGIKCFLADGSVGSPPAAHPLLEFDRSFLGRRDAGTTITLETWMTAKGAAGDLILQMDIEGAEYDVLFSTPSAVLRRFRIMIIELHNLNRLASPDYCHYVTLLLEKVTQDFVVCHLHPNNRLPCVAIREIQIPPLLEVTFLRKDRAKANLPVLTVRHPLDRPNVADRPDVELSGAWCGD